MARAGWATIDPTGTIQQGDLSFDCTRLNNTVSFSASAGFRNSASGSFDNLPWFSRLRVNGNLVIGDTQIKGNQAAIQYQEFWTSTVSENIAVASNSSQIPVSADWWESGASGTRDNNFAIPGISVPTLASATVQYITENSATITAAISNPGLNCTPDNIKIEYGTDTSYGTNIVISGGSAVFNLTDLDDDTIYFFRITGTNGAGLSSAEAGSFKTDVGSMGKLIDGVNDQDFEIYLISSDGTVAQREVVFV